MRLRPRGFSEPQRKTCLKERVWDFLPKVTQASGVIEIWCQVKTTKATVYLAGGRLLATFSPEEGQMPKVQSLVTVIKVF